MADKEKVVKKLKVDRVVDHTTWGNKKGPGKPYVRVEAGQHILYVPAEDPIAKAASEGKTIKIVVID